MNISRHKIRSLIIESINNFLTEGLSDIESEARTYSINNPDTTVHLYKADPSKNTGTIVVMVDGQDQEYIDTDIGTAEYKDHMFDNLHAPFNKVKTFGFGKDVDFA